MKYINIHCHKSEQLNGIIQVQSLFHSEFEQVVNYPDRFYSIGIHPWHCMEIDISNSISKINEFAKQKNVIALGECGLDKLKGTDFKIQKEIFIKQVLISEALKKPLIIHCVKAFEELVKLKQQLKPTMPWIIHGFRHNKEIAEKLISTGFYLSFGIHLTKENQSLNKIYSELPENSFFFETDEEEGMKIKLIYESAATISNSTIDDLMKNQYKIFKECFEVAI